MIERLKQIGKIDVGKLLRVDVGRMTLLPFIMILSVVVNTSISINVLELSALSYLALAMVLLSFIIMSYLYLRKGSLSKLVLMAVLFEMMLMVSTIINGTDMKKCFYDGCSVIFIAIICDYYKDRFHMLIAAFAIAFSICAYLNFFHLMLHPDLWMINDLKTNQGYLLGSNYNQMGCRLLCAVGTSMACIKYNKWWLLNVILVTTASLATLFIVGSMTSLTGIILFLVFSLILPKKSLKAGIVSLLVFIFLFQVFVCFQGKGIEHNSFAVYIVEDVLGKDITFTYRTYLWDAAAKLFVNSPLYGYGCVDNDWYYSHMSSIAAGTHNYIWAILVTGGVILLAIFFYICFLSYSRLLITTDKSALQLFAAATILFMMMIMENYPHPFIFTLLFLPSFATRSNSA